MLFKIAGNTSFISKNVKRTFKSTDIGSFKSEKTVKKLQKPASLSAISTTALSRITQTSLDYHIFRQFDDLFSTLNNVIRLQYVAMQLAASFEIVQHKNRQLKVVLFDEKKRHKQEKRLSLTGEEATDAPEFYSPSCILKARAFQENKETIIQEEIHQKAFKKTEKKRVRIQKLAKQQKIKLQKEMAHKLTKKMKEAEKAKKGTEIEQRKTDRILATRTKELATEQCKQEGRKHKNAVVIVAVAISSKTGSKCAPAVSRKSVRKAPIPHKKVAIRTAKTSRTTSSKRQADPAAPAAGIDVAVTVSSTRSRSGRTVTMSARFEE